MNQIDVTPIEIRDYAISYGWTLIKDALKDGLFVLNSPGNDYKQLVFPIENNSSEYNNMAGLAVNKLSDSLKKSTFSLIEEIREVNDDVLSIRYYSDNKVVNSLSFQETLQSIEATKQMILTAGSSVVHPALYHKRLSRTEAVDLLKKTRFRHTETGSFVIKISCPIKLEGPSTPSLFGDEAAKPISRKAFELINQASIQIINAVEEDSFNELLENQQQAEKPLISYNLCDSLIELFDDERELPFEMKFNWSRGYLSKLAPIGLPTSTKFPYSFKSKLEELKSYFSPQNKEAIDTFFGTVESLNGNEGDDGRRSGEVILALIIESEIVNARVILDADKYKVAYNAHGQGGGLIKVKGKLFPGKRVRMLDEISVFELVNK